MKKLFFLLVLIFIPISIQAQYGFRPVVYQTGAPSGTCYEVVIVDRATGITYNCVSGSWLPASIGTIGVISGGTGLTAVSQGDLIYGSASNVYSRLSKDTNATRYLSNTGTSNNPAWAQVNLANGVTGNLPVANLNSGTSASSSTFWRGDGTWATPPTTSPGGSSGDLQTNNGSGGFGSITPGTSVSTFLATPSSANLRAALTDESGTGAAFFAGGNIGAASGTSLALGTNPAASGTLMLPNNVSISFRNAANNGDQAALSVDGSNSIRFAGGLWTISTASGAFSPIGAYSISAGSVAPTSNASGDLGSSSLRWRQLWIDATITTAGTTGNQTINKAAGTVNIAASGTTVTVTNSLVTANSIIDVTARTNDATCAVKNYVPASGSFVVNMTAACTAETSVGFHVINQ